ncbi:MAG: sensor histidine kinase [Bacteriovoracia bacterium]
MFKPGKFLQQKNIFSSRWTFALQTVWLVTLMLLGGWWTAFVLQQGNRIATLEKALGYAQAEIHWEKTQRMLFWEAGTFFLLLFGISLTVFFLYWRDQKRLSALQAFFASSTHELRTPLSSIRLQGEALFEGVAPENKKLVSRLLNDVTRLEAQVERTLELSRVEGGGSLAIQKIDLSAWIKRAFAQFSETYPSKHMKISTDVQSSVVSADPNALHIIFRNLLENSNKHSLSLEKPIEIKSYAKGKWVVVEYFDKAANVSISQDDLGKLFVKGPQSNGTGVGLYLIRALMKKMGGQADYSVDSGSHGFKARLWFSKTEVSA